MATIVYFVMLSLYFWLIFNVIVSVDGGYSATQRDVTYGPNRFVYSVLSAL